MTAFNTSQLPASIDSVEKLSAWCSSVLNYLYNDVTVAESVNNNTRVAQSAPFELTSTDPFSWRLISRQSLPLSRDWISAGKVWEYAQPLGSATIPTSFQS